MFFVKMNDIIRHLNVIVCIDPYCCRRLDNLILDQKMVLVS